MTSATKQGNNYRFTDINAQSDKLKMFKTNNRASAVEEPVGVSSKFKKFTLEHDASDSVESGSYDSGTSKIP